MSLDYEDYGDVEDEIAGIRSSRKGGKTGWKEGSRPKEKLTPREILETYLARFNPGIDASKEKAEELAAKKEKYLSWVNRALLDPEDLMSESDIKVTFPKKSEVNVWHSPSNFYARQEGGTDESRVTFAKEELSIQLEKHLNLWRKTPEDFRNSHEVLLTDKKSSRL